MLYTEDIKYTIPASDEDAEDIINIVETMLRKHGGHVCIERNEAYIYVISFTTKSIDKRQLLSHEGQ